MHFVSERGFEFETNTFVFMLLSVLWNDATRLYMVGVMVNGSCAGRFFWQAILRSVRLRVTCFQCFYSLQRKVRNNEFRLENESLQL